LPSGAIEMPRMLRRNISRLRKPGKPKCVKLVFSIGYITGMDKL
jgi:hypothetical protein